MSRPARSRRRALILAAVGFGLLSPLVPSSALAEGTMPAPEPPPAVSPAPPPPAPPAPPAPPPPPPAPVVVAPPAAPAGLDPRCGGWGKVVCASKSARMLWLVDNGVVTLSFQARFGGKRTPTREGTFAVGWKSANHKSKLYRSSMPYAPEIPSG